MSKAYKCDICKKFFEETSETEPINITICRYDQTHVVDMCDSCYHNIETLISDNIKAKRGSKLSLYHDAFGLF